MNKARVWLMALAGTLAAAGVFWAVTAYTNAQAAPVATTLTVPRMTLESVSGQAISIPGSGVTVLYFMSAQCSSCAAGAHQLLGLVNQLPPGARLVSVDVAPGQDTPHLLAQFNSSVGVTWPQVYATNAMLQAYHVTALDEVAVVNARGQVTYVGALLPVAKLARIVNRTAG